MNLLNKKIMILAIICIGAFAIVAVSAQSGLFEKDDGIHQVSMMQVFMHVVMMV